MLGEQKLNNIIRITFKIYGLILYKLNKKKYWTLLQYNEKQIIKIIITFIITVGFNATPIICKINWY